MTRLIQALLSGDAVYFWGHKEEFTDFNILQGLARCEDPGIAIKAQKVLAHASCKHFINLALEAEAIYLEVLSAFFN